MFRIQSHNDSYDFYDPATILRAFHSLDQIYTHSPYEHSVAILHLHTALHGKGVFVFLILLFWKTKKLAVPFCACYGLPKKDGRHMSAGV